MGEEKTVHAAQSESRYRFSEETAANELKALFEYYELDLDEIEDETMRNAIKQGYDRLIKAVRLGRLTIVTDDKQGIVITQKLRSSGTEINYREIDGAAKTAMAGKKADDHFGKAYALLGHLSGLGESAIKSLKGVDLSLAEVLGLIFLSV